MLQNYTGPYPKPTTTSQNQPTSPKSFTTRLSYFNPHLKKKNYIGVKFKPILKVTAFSINKT
jgi:hypothetical protein